MLSLEITGAGKESRTPDLNHWQGYALLTELFPHWITNSYSVSAPRVKTRIAARIQASTLAIDFAT